MKGLPAELTTIIMKTYLNKQAGWYYEKFTLKLRVNVDFCWPQHIYVYIQACTNNIENNAHGWIKSVLIWSPYLTICHHRKVGLESVRCSIYSVMWQSVLILPVWLLRSIPGPAGVREAVVSCVTLVLLRGGERVEIFLDVTLRLRVEFCLKGRQLLGHPEKPSNFYA